MFSAIEWFDRGCLGVREMIIEAEAYDPKITLDIFRHDSGFHAVVQDDEKYWYYNDWYLSELVYEVLGETEGWNFTFVHPDYATLVANILYSEVL